MKTRIILLPESKESFDVMNPVLMLQHMVTKAGHTHKYIHKLYSNKYRVFLTSKI